eukprot:TRINITY_DN10260_c0_g2_i1.p3 TRINITY_DN10260_c0_g2~~TRINITY_DN10260_c0_g2_i1.p3  ORF type:complete len:101 (+),score=7.03 TRINITY_DN10260_c0_g2_i1:481-783(+)
MQQIRCYILRMGQEVKLKPLQPQSQRTTGWLWAGPILEQPLMHARNANAVAYLVQSVHFNLRQAFADTATGFVIDQCQLGASNRLLGFGFWLHNAYRKSN